MDAGGLNSLIRQGEGAHVEFKRCGSKPEADTFETICAFANRFGGSVLLGVADDGAVEGVGGRALDIERNIANVVSNGELFSPSPLVETERIDIEGKAVVRVWVPAGPEVYRFKGKVYDRVADADVRARSATRVAAMHVRKQQLYTERQVFPHAREEDLRDDLIERAREMALRKRRGHPWGDMGNDELLRSARLYARDEETGEEGLTRAAILLLGDDEVIRSACPAYRTDAIYATGDGLRRYEDRAIVATNLLESFDLLMDFCRKHTDDPFYLDGAQAVSVRDVICRELVANTLMHREYLSPVTARLTIAPEGIKTENASRAAFDGPLTLRNLSPVPKNPTIADFFLQVGLAEELGSGLRSLYRYSKPFMGADPVVVEGDVFTALIPDARSLQGGPRAANPVDAAIADLLEASGEARSADVAEMAGVSQRTASAHLAKMVESGELEPVGNTNTRRYVRARAGKR